MKQIILGSLNWLLVVGLIGCAANDDSSTKTVNPAVPPPLGEEIVVETGETAEQYYKNFQFLRVRYCPEIFYRYAGTGDFVIGKDETGRDLDGRLAVLLRPNGLFKAFYIETSLNSNYRFLFAETLKLNIQGKWKIDGLDIVIGDLGRGKPLVVQGKRTIQFTFGRDLIREGLKNTTQGIIVLTSNSYRIAELDNCPSARLEDPGPSFVNPNPIQLIPEEGFIHE